MIVVVTVVEVEIHFVFILIEETKREPSRPPTLCFPDLIFHLCSDSDVPFWHYYMLLQATKTIDIGLI